MKVIIAGSRTITSAIRVAEAIEEAGFAITEVVSGHSRGVDKIGEQWAVSRNIPIKKFPAEWEKYGKAAGPIRNRQMAKYADALIAIRSGSSRGTTDMIEAMDALKKTYYVKELIS